MELSVEDRLAINDLFAVSCFRIDHGDAVGWADLFIDDGELIVDGVLRAQGRSQLIEYIENLNRSGKQISHWISNIWIFTNEFQVGAHVYIMAFDISSTIESPFVLGEYNDDLVKVRGTWKFKTKRMKARIRKTSSSLATG